MSDQAVGKRIPIVWFAAILVCVGIASFSLFLRFRVVALEQDRDALLAKLSDQQQRKERLGELVAQSREIQIRQASEMKELQKLGKRVTTRDEFLVTSGDKIVRQLAVYAPSGERRLLFYVPEGDHRLVYAIREFLGARSETYAAMYKWGGDHRTLPETASIDLSGETVYELRTRVNRGTDEPVSIQLFGPGDVVVYDDSFPLSYPTMTGLSNLQNDSEIFASYPNELRTAGEAKRHVDTKKAAPVTPLLTFTLDHLGGRDADSKARVKMRFWIDSNSPPCISDIGVAVSYDFLSSNLQYAPGRTNFEGFNQIFQPYDGSGRYFFSDGYFPEAVKTEVGDR